MPISTLLMPALALCCGVLRPMAPFPAHQWWLTGLSMSAHRIIICMLFACRPYQDLENDGTSFTPEARDWYAHVLAVRSQAFGVQHPKTAERASILWQLSSEE